MLRLPGRSSEQKDWPRNGRISSRQGSIAECCRQTAPGVRRHTLSIVLPTRLKSAATRGNLTCRLSLSFRKSSPRIKQQPAENRDQQPDCVYFVGNTRSVLAGSLIRVLAGSLIRVLAGLSRCQQR